MLNKDYLFQVFWKFIYSHITSSS